MIKKYMALLISCQIRGIITIDGTRTLGFMQIQIKKRDKYGKY